MHILAGGVRNISIYQDSGAVVSAVASQQEGSRFESPNSVYQQRLHLLPLPAWALSTPPSSHIGGEMKW